MLLFSFSLFFLSLHGRRCEDKLLRLVELSLDLELQDNSVQFLFSARPVPGVVVEETNATVAVYVTLTDGCIFRITFAHPSVLPVRGQGREDSCLRHQQSVLSWVTGIAPLQCTGVDRALLLRGADGAVSVHVLPPVDTPGDELYRAAPLTRPAPVMRRLLGFLPQLLGADRQGADVSGMAMCRAGGWHFAFALSTGLSLSVARVAAAAGPLQPTTVLQQSLLDLLPDAEGVLAAATPDTRHLLRIAPSPYGGHHATLAVGLSLGAQSRVLVFHLDLLDANGQVSMHLTSIKHGLPVSFARSMSLSLTSVFVLVSRCVPGATDRSMLGAMPCLGHIRSQRLLRCPQPVCKAGKTKKENDDDDDGKGVELRRVGGTNE